MARRSALDCIAEIKAATGDRLSDDQIEQVLDEMDRRRRAARAGEGLESAETALAKAADELADEVKLEAIIEKRSRAINVVRKQERLRFYDGFDDKSEGVQALNVGINRVVTGGRLSVDGRTQAIEGELLGGLMSDLRRDDLLVFVRNRTLDREVARELEALELGDAAVTGSADARRLAEIVHKYQEQGRLLQNRAGGFIRKEPGYITRQSHDMMKLRRAGFDAWRDAVLPALDQKRTFEGVENVNEFLRAAYTGLASGEHLKSHNQSDWLGGFKGPGNLAKRVSRSRVLHFKGADAWFDYNERFGVGTLFETVTHGLRTAAQNTALMRVWGTNPRAAFDADIAQLKQEAARASNIKQVDRLRRNALENQFRTVDGTIRIPVNPTLAHIGAVVRAVQNMSKLGFATLSSIGDPLLKAVKLRHQGIGLLEGYANGLESIMQGRTKGEKREIADLLGVGLDGQLGMVMNRFSAQDHLPGKMAKLQQTFFELSGLSWWTDAHATGAGLMLARNLAMQRGKAFSGLHEGLQRALRQSGIDEAEWNIVRRVAAKTADGREYLTPDMIDGLDDALFSGNARAIRRQKDNLKTALGSYYIDTVDAAVIMPGARERAIMLQGTQPGTVIGEALRFMMQFKSFPVSVATKVIGGELAQPGGRVVGMGHLLVGMTIMGYLAMSAKDLAKGRTPRDPTLPETWTAAFVQGGGAGIYGDFLFGEFNRFGRSIVETAAGPAIGTFADLAAIFAGFRQGEDKSAKLVRTMISNTPFANLFYTKAALDYLFLFQIQEAMNPGYLRRVERRMAKRGQAFLVPPSRTIPRGGGSRFAEGIR